MVGNSLNIATTREEMNYSITNLSGQIIASGNVKDHKVDVSGLSSGIYMIEIESGGKSVFRKFVKQ